MGHKFAEIAFTESVRAVQREQGSRSGYAAMDAGADTNQRIGPREREFIAGRDSFYMASVGDTGWPYVQHRGGPAGFMKVLDERTIGFADFSGNRQYVSVGNFSKDDRVSLFFMDYPNQQRLKLLGRVRVLNDSENGLLAELEDDDFSARVERGFLIEVEAFDWNCPQHITPRYTDAEIETLSMKPSAIGDGTLELEISGVRQLTPRVRAFELKSTSGSALPAVKAGAHLEVPVIVDGQDRVRHYSISSDPGRRDRYEIAVLREEDGSGGSRAVHEQFELGLILKCGTPKNQFPLHEDDRPAVLIAGGIGITPVKAMAHALKTRGTSMQIHYAGRSGNEMAFAGELAAEFGAGLSTYSSADGARLDIARVLAEAPSNAVFYVCGSERLVAGVVDAAGRLEIDLRRVRVERFSADLPADARSFELELTRSRKRLTVAADQTVLDTLLDAGVDVPFSCRTGLCGTCKVRVLDGPVDHRDSVLKAHERNCEGLMCACVSRAAGESLAIEL